MIPSSVYRLQMSKACTLKKAMALIPYLSDLGVEGIECSPIFEAFSSGYDITNPNRLNPALGTLREFETFCKCLKKNEMSLVLDIVPNHMGIKGLNRWWIDVLEKGPHSPFAGFFDINWKPEKKELCCKILLPILKGIYGKVLENKEIQLVWKKGFWIRYFDFLLPVRKHSYAYILRKSKKIREALARFNQSPDLLHQLLEKQFYRLSFWEVAGQEINYRRFFNINELIALHIEKEKVLRSHHQWIFHLITTHKVQGLRIDHPDGLYDPSQYFERIRQIKPRFVWVEKILDFKEPLPEWNVDGTVGYEFLNHLCGIFIRKKNEGKITKIYESFIHEKPKIEEIHYERKKTYIALQMSSEVNYLGFLLAQLAEKNRMFRDFTKADLTRGVLEIIANFPVYRTYIKPGSEIRKQDRSYVQLAVDRAKKRAPEIHSSVFDYIQGLLLLESAFLTEEKERADDFLLRFQQLTAPVMAKGLEDSTYYIYNRLISLNEVGNNPQNFGCSKEEFHEENQNKLAKWPYGALISSTHDSKYSLDARLRIHMISERPDPWERLVKALKKENQKDKTDLFPDWNTEYLIYQMLIALWPVSFTRLWTCLNKAIRQAGVYTSWHSVNIFYENAVKKFLRSILKKKNRLFLKFHSEISKAAHWNSLSAFVLMAGSPGIVNVYQGEEWMRLSLMDPDNRRPLNFRKKNPPAKKEIMSKVLNFRKQHKDLFLQGDYIPLETADSAIGFVRQWNGQKIVILARRFFYDGKKMGSLQIKNFRGCCIFTKREFSGKINLDEVLHPTPFAMLYDET